MKNKITILFLLFLSILVIGCTNSKDTSDSTANEGNKQQEQEETVTLLISAAVSLTDALEEIKTAYENDHNVKLTFNLGGSGTLAQQIEQGAPTDIFISANQEWMDTLKDDGLIIDSTRTDVTGNNLVLVANESSNLTYESFADISADSLDKIAIGNPNSVPAGKYTEEALIELNKWDELKDKFVLAKDVRQVLTYVETGNAEIGFVYESDALTSDQVKIIAKADQDLHDPIIYPIAVIKDTKYEKAATDFVNFMESEEAQGILEKYGFRK